MIKRPVREAGAPELLALPVVAGSAALIVVNETAAIAPTLLLLLVVTFGGVLVLRWLSGRLADPQIRWLVYVHLLKIPLVLGVLYFAWAPWLGAAGSTWLHPGYDPQRYYFLANDLADNGFDPSRLPPLNYTGILYYYGAIFKVLGHNTAIPALFNIAVTLLAVSFLIYVSYSVRPQRLPRDWMLGLLMVVPEIVWFDCTTSRETPAMCLLLTVVLVVLALLRRTTRAWTALWMLPLGIASLGLLALIRTTAVLTAMACALAVFLTTRARGARRLPVLIGIIAMALVAAIGPSLAEGVGSSSGDDYGSQLDSGIGLRGSDEDSFTWSERSIGLLFRPTSRADIALFALPRMVLYLAAPLPNVPPIGSLPEGRWDDWEGMAAVLSALLYLLLTPFTIAWAIEGWRKRQPDHFVFILPLILTLGSIAAGTQVLHERYRIMMLPFLAVCIWEGRRASKGTVKLAFSLWWGLLACSAALFVLYKQGLI